MTRNQAQVDLRRVQTGVAQELLDVADVRSASQQVDGDGVLEDMGMQGAAGGRPKSDLAPFLQATAKNEANWRKRASIKRLR